MLTRRLDERERVESCEERLAVRSRSSGLCADGGDAAVAWIEARLSDRPCGWRLGGGGGFFICEAVDGGVGMGAFGGVGS
jgi:hypothetical protein